MAQWVRSLDLTTHTSLSPIRRGFVPGFVNYKKGCTRLAAASDKAYQLLVHGWWFSTASSIAKTGRHDITELLLKVVLKHQKSNTYIWNEFTSAENKEPVIANLVINLTSEVVLHIILKVGHPRIILPQISKQKILMWFLSHNIPRWNKLAEKISQKNPKCMLNYSLPCSCSSNLISFWLILKQQWTIEKISIF